ncbi:dicarboxylate/amino acid:cation symporter [Salicibibacter cibi]|uniref:Dicarboxylate/amino acid:cation symporter n=1 Tax=Salicibibacter cibi TaxID=2743001 RepID=A0A7T6Z9D9_9BACI|nr:dicarboxylate/amino acid:cation symporter [Salicibibacter cibi]QQK79299.1 dicarboxylate/amino acid:cation symporter [Salicibibacter cibi]
MSLSTRIFLALGAGILFGGFINLYFPGWVEPLDENLLQPVGDIFLRAIQLIVVPLVFVALIMGLTQLRGTGNVARYTSKLMSLYIVTSAIAIFFGLVVAFIVRPGDSAEPIATGEGETEEGQSLLDWLVSIVPENPFEALVSGNLLQVIVLAALVGTAINLLSDDKTHPFIDVIESVYEIVQKVLELVLKIAPFGVFALIASMVASQGFNIIANLAVYVLGLILAIILMIGLYALFLFIAGAKPRTFFKGFAPAFTLAFGTASSNAALPVALNGAEKAGLQNELSRFAIPFGTALKRDGAGILQGFNAIFVAQLFGVDMTIELVLTIFLSALLVSFSTAGVPGAGIIMMTTVLSAANLPLEGIAIVAGIDRITEGFRTLLNVVGNTANASLLQQWENRRGEAPK